MVKYFGSIISSVNISTSPVESRREMSRSPEKDGGEVSDLDHYILISSPSEAKWMFLPLKKGVTEISVMRIKRATQTHNASGRCRRRRGSTVLACCAGWTVRGSQISVGFILKGTLMFHCISIVEPQISTSWWQTANISRPVSNQVAGFFYGLLKRRY